MQIQRWRSAFFSALAVLVIWLIAIVGYQVAKNARVTAEKVRVYVESTNLSKLKGEARANAIRRLADMLNALSIEERRKARFERLARNWLEEMTDDEKAGFIEATMPTGFKQMIEAFEQLPEDKRRKAIDDTMRQLRQEKARLEDSSSDDPSPDTNGPPPLSPELEAKIRTIGLKTFYSQSSPQTKAELAPVLEELQRVMESGRPFRGR
jgi:hypothetical protein